MAKRVFICTDTDYPQLDASSNYVSNLAKALCISDFEVFIISLDRSGKSYGKWKKNISGIGYFCVNYRDNPKIALVISRIKGASRMLDAIKSQGCQSGDVLLIYLNKWYFSMPVVDWAKSNGVEVWASVVEWFEKDSFNQTKCYESYAKCDGILAISKNIERHFADLGLKTVIVPPLVDMSNRKCFMMKNRNDNKVHFLYTGNFVGKDDMKVMLEALALLPEEKRRLVEYHITRYDDETLVGASDIDEITWKSVCNSVVTHGNVTQEQLQMLLIESDFLTIARPINRTTISNFPSKVPESMAYGIVPIMTRVGDCPNYYLTDGFDSILFDACTPEHCAEAFEKAIEEVQLGNIIEMKRNAFETAKKRFDVCGFGERLKRI